MKLKAGLLTGLILYLFIPHYAAAQKSDPPFLEYTSHPWVDSVMKSLTTEERIAQLVWIAGFANRGISYDVELSNTVRQYGIGGVIFFQGNAAKQAEMINHFRSISKVPPLIAIDGEYGVGMRLEGITMFPYQLTLGAVQNDTVIYRMGSAIAEQCRRAGININLAPVADVNYNPSNPVINYRSFGEDPENVSRKTLMYMKGLQDNGIIAAAKHFPGHGDTETDSHIDLPRIMHSRARLDSVELKPFRYLINAGIEGVMPGHLWIPSIEPVTDIPSTISGKVLTELLRNELGFRGLILSDAMNMGGITRYSRTGEAELLSLIAGMDVLEYVTDPRQTISRIAAGIKKGEISMEAIDEKCRRVLAAKFRAGLGAPVPVEPESIASELNSADNEALIRDLYAASLTVIQNKGDIIPLRRLDTLRIATIAVNSKEITTFQKRAGSYLASGHYKIDSLTDRNIEQLLSELKGYDLVLGGIFGTQMKPASGFGIPERTDELISRIAGQNRSVFTFFGNPYAAAMIPSLKRSDAVIIAYQDNEITGDLAAQLIFGAIGASGRLPVTIDRDYPSGTGIFTSGGLRTGFGLPENAGVRSSFLEPKVDSIAMAGIEAGAYPGCEVMIAVRGNVIFHKTYGYQTYDNRTPVSEEDLFDLASVTKITGSLPGLMLLDAQGKFTINETLGRYIRDFKRSDKPDIVIKDMLAHQAGLVAWIPFWRETVRKNGEFKARTFRHEQSPRYPLKVADNLYIYKNYRDKIFRRIGSSSLSAEKKYVYSDLAFIIAPELIASITGENWFEFVKKNIYSRIGAKDITFNPYLSYPLSRIVPTEYDSLFRKQQLHGTVHDEGAAMLGGISGHAGLFATAGDLMKLMEMYRRMGSYGGEQIISNETLKKYTSYQFPENNNRRGLGFDKPSVKIGDPELKNPYPTKSATPWSFGHSGYTGPFVWIDPVKEFTYIFLCNRVYPTRNNNKITDLNIRTGILEAVYESIR